jgi:hypothetical protein
MLLKRCGVITLDFLRRIAQVFSELQVPYFITGAMASGAYGEPRMTNNIDVVANLKLPELPLLFAAFPDPDYYCSPEAATQAVLTGFQFNIITQSANRPTFLSEPARLL